MTTVNGATSATNVYEGINQRYADQRTVQAQSEDNQMFMSLLIAQLKNQDPTSPTDTNAFMQQISSMSMVEGITNLNTEMKNLSGTMLTSQTALQASSMVGRSIYIEQGNAPIGINGAKDWAEGKMVLPEDTENLTLKVYHPDGSLLGEAEYGKQEAGDVPFVWQSPVDYVYTDELEDPAKPHDPEANPYKKQPVNPDQPYDEQTNPWAMKARFAPGEYRFSAEIQLGDGSRKVVPVEIKMPVNSVSVGAGGTSLEYNTPSGTYKQTDVKEISV
ncbi:MAG: hypothetical protein OIF57_12845 [Marinobacterium sp.]|nr:hypothetical protein [Marinobacterium sp.]